MKNNILATDGAPDFTDPSIFRIWNVFWLHRSPQTWFCVKSIKCCILHLQLQGFVKRMLKNCQNLFQSFRMFVVHPLRVQNNKKQSVQPTGFVQVKLSFGKVAVQNAMKIKLWKRFWQILSILFTNPCSCRCKIQHLIDFTQNHVCGDRWSQKMFHILKIAGYVESGAPPVARILFFTNCVGRHNFSSPHARIC